MRFNLNKLSIIHLYPFCLPKLITRNVSKLQKLEGIPSVRLLLSSYEEREEITIRKMMMTNFDKNVSKKHSLRRRLDKNVIFLGSLGIPPAKLFPPLLLIKRI